MLKIILLFTSFAAFIIIGHAQEIISTSGQFANGSQGSLSWTLGEPITETASGLTNILTQGFQQDFERFAGNSELYLTDQFEIYPNPFTSEINLHSNLASLKYRVLVTDTKMKQVREINFILPHGISSYKIDLSTLSSGLYFLTIYSGESAESITKRIIKIDENH